MIKKQIIQILSQEQTIEVRKKIGETIKNTRLKWEYTYYELAINSGVSIGTLHKIEEGSTAYTVDSLIKVCALLKINNLKIT